MISKRIERTVIRNTNVIELLDDLDVSYKRYGDEVRIVCPFHQNANGYNLSINVEKRVFCCFSHGCEKNGYNLVDLVMRIMKTDDRERAIRYMASLANLEIDLLCRNITKYSYKNKKGLLSFKDSTLSFIKEYRTVEAEDESAVYKESQIREWHNALLESKYPLRYLTEERKLTDWDIENFWIGFDPEEEDIIFPVYSTDGKLKAVVRRTLSEEKAEYFGKYKVIGAKSECLYGLYEAQGEGYDLSKIILVEGVFDAIALHRMGYTAVALLGTSISKYQLKLLYELSPAEIILCLDNDSCKGEDEDSGKNGVIRSINQFSKAGFNLDEISVIQLSGYQDPDEVPEKEFRKMYENRISAIDFYLMQQIR
ncbi:MAG: toprim domain-containing protein [Thermovenabulum sp.]|uniref:toprim domain-containing protein n=1 Tax=Thermovenabulum sp. TaxID=3100335 RepID=UPI003C7DB73A